MTRVAIPAGRAPGTIRCPACAAPVMVWRLRLHIERVHGHAPLDDIDDAGPAARSSPSPSPPPARPAELATALPLRSPVLAVVPAGTSLALTTRRGRRIDAAGRCDGCGSLAPTRWRHGLRDGGSAALCALCRSAALDASFGRIDAMDRAERVGGFETSRRRH